MRKIKYLLIVILMFIFIPVVNAETSFSLVGDSKVNQGKEIKYDVILNTDSEVNGFEFELNIDDDLEYVNHQSNIEGLIVKISDDKSKVIGYGTVLKDGDNLLTIAFSSDDVSKTTNVNTKIENVILNGLNNNVIEASDVTKVTKVVVPTKSNSNSTTSATNTSTVVDDENIIDNKEDKPLVEEETEPVDVPEVENESNVSKIVKIVLIILIGALILFLLNKENKEDEAPVSNEKNKEDKNKESKK